MPLPKLMFSALAFSSTLTGMSFCRRRCPTTSSRLGSSISPAVMSPFRPRAVYANVGMSLLRPCPMKSGPGPGPGPPHSLRLRRHAFRHLLSGHAQELVRVVRVLQAVLERDFTLDVELIQRIVHRLR